MKSYGPYMAPLESNLTPIPQIWQTTMIAENASKHQLLQRKSMQNKFDKFWKKWHVLFLRTMRSGVRISPGRYIERLSLSGLAKIEPFFIGSDQTKPVYAGYAICTFMDETLKVINQLEAEGIITKDDTFEDVPTRVFQYEYLLAIMVQVGRDKDKVRITTSLESKEPDQVKLDDILQRYDLLDTWLGIVSRD